MTYLEKLAIDSVSRSLATTLDRTLERVAEDLAAELLKDPEFRAQVRELARRAFLDALTGLDRPEDR